MKQKHKITALLTAFCLLLSMLPISSLTAQAAGGVLTGSGTQQSPYQIEDAADLRAFANLVNNGGGTYAWGELTADIDLNPGYTFHEDGSWSYSGMEENPGEPAGWAPIGKANTSYYRGTFEGNGHTVSGIYVTGEQYAGMFGYVFIGTVQNLNVENSYIHAEYNGLGRAGGIAAAVGAPASSASLQNCTSSAFVSASILWGSAGGIAGDAGVNANVSNCYATGSVTGIRNSSESFSDVNVGGVVGDLSGTLSNSYATGSVTVTAINDSSNSNVFAGGVVGYIEGNSIRLSNSYALAGNGASQTIGHIGVGNTTVTNVELRSADQMQSSEFAETLNNGQRPAAWRSDYKSISINNGYPVLAYQVPFEGSGTEDDPYLIATLEELIDFRDIVNTGSTDVCARLIADIDLNPDFTISSDEGYTGSGTPEQWTPIGSSYDYSGVFDGDGHTITGLYININTTSYDGGYYGLFGRVNGGTVRDINLTNSYLSVTCNGYIWIGSIVGSMSNGTISGCTSDAAVSAAVGASEVYAGGIVGNVSGLDVASTVENCGNTGTVSASSWQYSYVGGVVGRTDFTAPTICGTVSGCYNTGNVTATTTSVPSYPYAGGVVGNNSGDLINCYNTGAVSANANGPVPANAYAYAGGVAGRHDGNNDPVLSYSYNTGSVTAVSTGTTYIGGVVGRNMDTVTDVYYLTGTANVGIGNAASNPSGVWPRAEDEMKEAAMVTSLNRDQSPAPWQMDHTIDGEQVNGGYPILFWQGVFNGGVGTQEEPYLIATKE